MKVNPMTKSALAATLIAGAFLFAAPSVEAQEERWLHIRVQEEGDANIAVNLPLSVVGTAADIVPEDVRRMELDGADVTVADLRAMWTELSQHPNEQLVKVDEPDQKVVVSLIDGYLMVNASGRDNVQVRIPVEVVDALFSGDGEELQIGKALEMLAQTGPQELVTVDGDGETVRIWVDGVAHGGDG